MEERGEGEGGTAQLDIEGGVTNKAEGPFSSFHDYTGGLRMLSPLPAAQLRVACVLIFLCIVARPS